MQKQSMLLGFGFAIALVGTIYAMIRLIPWLIERRRVARLIGASLLTRELAIVAGQRRLLEPKFKRFQGFRDEMAATLRGFEGTRAEADLRLRAGRVEEALEELQRAFDKACRLEAELRMQRGALVLFRDIEKELARGKRPSPEELAARSLAIKTAIWQAAEPSVRAFMGQGSSAQNLLDDAHESLREYLAALWLRDFQADASPEVSTERFEALSMMPNRLASFEEGMRELEARTLAVVEVERMLGGKGYRGRTAGQET